MQRLQDILVVTIAARMHRYRLRLVRAIDFDLEGIEFDPHLRCGPVGGYAVTIGVYLYLAIAVEPSRYFPAVVKGVQGQRAQQGAFFLPSLANSLGLPIHPTLIILHASLS